jgi:hypothetical protein
VDKLRQVSEIHAGKADQQTIEELEALLEKAKNGTLQAFLFVDRYQDGAVGWGWAGAPDRQMIGALEDLKFNFYLKANLIAEED